MIITEISNWLSFNIYLSPNTLLGGIANYQKWYFKFLKDILQPFLEKYRKIIVYVFFGDYFYNKPVDEVKISAVNLGDWIKGLENLKNTKNLSQMEINQIQESIRYIRLRLFVENNQQDEIVDEITDQIKDIEYF